MAEFFTPKRRARRDENERSHRKQKSAGASNLSSFSDLDDIPLLDSNDDAPLPPLSSWKKLRKRVSIHRQGSILYRNTAREDHLRHLFLKRRIRESIIKSMSVFSDRHVQIERIQEEDGKDGADGYELSIRELDSGLGAKWDEDFIEELRAEVEEEMDHGTESAKIREINEIGRKYRKHLKGLNEFPLEVRLQNVSYTVQVDESSSKIKTVYNASFLYPATQALLRLWKRERKEKHGLKSKHVLSNISLVLKPGKQYLVLGPPGSGKSSLLRAITGLIHPKANASVEGSISYNGRTLEDCGGFYINNAFAYIDQLDKHAPRLTVDETFEFAYQCSTGGKLVRQRVPQGLEKVLKEADKDKLATKLALGTLGLAEVKDTFVGDGDVRGVSGGQRRRVTVGEMLMSGAPILCGDEVSTGLDAASTYDMTQVILHYGRIQKYTRIFAMLQPSPETVSLFDEVIVLAEGHVIYAGPIEDVEDYFAFIGFKSPEFTDVADFLQMVSTEDGAALYDPDDYLRVIRPNPPTAFELAEIFRNSDNGVNISTELSSPTQYVWTETEGSQHGGEVSNLVLSEAITRRYANRFPKSTSLICRRFLVLWLRDKRVIVAGIVKNVLMGVSVGGVFFNSTDEISIQGALFQAGLFIMLGSMPGASALLQDRLIYYKHTDANFYSAWPFMFGRALSQMPQTIFDTVMFASILYYMIGLADRDSASNFFIYLSLLISFALLMNAQLALFATFANNAQVQVYSSCTLLGMMLFGGFIIAPDAIPAYFQWLYWWNPFAWVYRGLIVNEFRNSRWEDPDQILVDAGFTDLKGDAFEQDWVRYSYFYMVPYYLGCCVWSALALSMLRPTSFSSPEILTKPEDDSGGSKKGKFDIPFKPITLSFHDISYEVTASTSKQQLKLLNNVSGIFRPGEMCALMGSSGAGKTTLMDVIALRKRTGDVSGTVQLNGWKQDPTTFRRSSGYVEQFDVQSPELTVRETVLFSARLRLDSNLVESDEEKQAFVDKIIRDVDLSDLALAVVGCDEGTGLSFEQKKRLSIAVELAASPSILFLDEPTSGLDARSASLVVKTLRKIADNNRTVCATIHQPSFAVINMFDELLLLQKGGRAVYHGPLGDNCSTLVSYFESRGASSISLGENPANWMLRIISEKSQNDLSQLYQESKEFSRLQKELDSVRDSDDATNKIKFESEFAASKGKRRELVRRRLQRIYWRSPTYNLARIMVSLLIAFLLGSVFIFRTDLEVYSEVDMRARVSVIFIAFIITGIMAIISVLPVMTKIRDMYYRHSDAGMYDSGSIGLALGVAEKYFILLSTSLFCIVFLATSKIGNTLFGLIAFWGFFTFNFAIYSYMGQLFVCLVQSTSTALILCSVFIGINNFFAGLIVRPQFMVGGFYAVPYYICPGHYIYESMVMAIYAHNDDQVLANAGSDFYEFLVKLPSCAIDESSTPICNNCTNGETNCIGTSFQYVDVFFGHEYSRDNQMRNALILGSILLLTRVLTWIALKKIRFAS